MEIRHGAKHGHLLDRLMGRPILADANAVMRKYIGQRYSHQRGKTRHGLCIITEYEEGSDKDAQSSMKHHSVADRGHRQLTDTEVQVASAAVIPGEVAHIRHIRLVGRR